MNDPEILEALQDPDVQKAFSVGCIAVFLKKKKKYDKNY
jgi:uncharacterized protein YjgD (DUF1641 family)